MSSGSKLVVLVFGSALGLLGLLVLFSGGVSLPTRHPPRRFHFSGLSLLLLSLPPLVVGLLSLAVARGYLQRESRAARHAVGISIICLGLAFALAHKA